MALFGKTAKQWRDETGNKKLKEIGFTDSEIKSIIIALQLEGLDLNKKKYD